MDFQDYLLMENNMDLVKRHSNDFYNTCWNGDLISFIQFHVLGTDIHMFDEAPLHIAIHYKHLNIIKYILNDSLCNIHHGTLLYLASRYGLIDIVKYLHQHGSDINIFNGTALMEAAFCNHFEVVRYLVENGADIQISSAISSASTNGNIDIVKYLLSHSPLIKIDPNHWSICNAAWNGQLDIVKYLHKNGADIHVRNDTPFKNAIQTKHLDVIKYLVYHGADINLISDISIKNDVSYYVKYKRIMDDCITQISGHPLLEKTISENLLIHQQFIHQKV